MARSHLVTPSKVRFDVPSREHMRRKGLNTILFLPRESNHMPNIDDEYHMRSLWMDVIVPSEGGVCSSWLTQLGSYLERFISCETGPLVIWDPVWFKEQWKQSHRCSWLAIRHDAATVARRFAWWRMTRAGLLIALLPRSAVPRALPPFTCLWLPHSLQLVSWMMMVMQRRTNLVLHPQVSTFVAPYTSA